MNSRLHSVKPGLAREIDSVSFSEAKEKVTVILSQTFASLPGESAKLLPNGFDALSHDVSQDQIDALDARYFELEEKGEAEKSADAFMAARFLSAVMSWQTAVSHFELCEAAYEANFAVEKA